MNEIGSLSALVQLPSDLSVFHSALDRVAKANQTAIKHLETLSARFTVQIGGKLRSANFVAVDAEPHAYQLEADSR